MDVNELRIHLTIANDELVVELTVADAMGETWISTASIPLKELAAALTDWQKTAAEAY